MFVNSEPPQARKARELAVSIANFEAQFLVHESYVDTTRLAEIPVHLVNAAENDRNRKHGFLAPSLRKRIIDAVNSHEVLAPAMKAKVLEERSDR